MKSKDSFNTYQEMQTASATYGIYDIGKLDKEAKNKIEKLPVSIKILLESLLRNEDGYIVTKEDILKLVNYKADTAGTFEIPFKPARVILQDFTGVPAVVDLAALRDAMKMLGGDPKKINPQIPVDLVIDHSVQVDAFNRPDAVKINTDMEYSRNMERYQFLRWGQNAFENFSVVPPGSGIVHQVNLEHLANVVQQNSDDNINVLYPDSLVGTDSHTTMINGLGVLGWGVGGIEAEAVMLGQPIYMKAPEVIGVNLSGKLEKGVTATDLVLKVTQMLREYGVVEKIVEFFGDGLDNLTLPDRATIANMAPEYGATMGFFPVDEETLRYMRLTGRSESQIELTREYCKAQKLLRSDAKNAEYTDVLELDVSTVKGAIAGPKRPQDRIELQDVKSEWSRVLQAPKEQGGFALNEEEVDCNAELKFADGKKEQLETGSVVIAAITSCTNTSNPSVMIGAGLLAKKAVELGLSVKSYVKTSLAPGSKAVTEYLNKSGLSTYLEKLGFHTVGYGCTSCIGNSGPLPEEVEEAIKSNNMVVSSVLSGNRNFEGRINPSVKANYLASPPLVVAYALAGNIDIDLTKDSIGKAKDGSEVYLRDVWPTHEEIADCLEKNINPEMFRNVYEGIGESSSVWNNIEISESELYPWNAKSTYIQLPPFFDGMSQNVDSISAIKDAKVLVMVGDSVTTDHISPAGAIPLDSAAAEYLKENGIEQKDFNTFGSRRGNDRIMTRGTFGNIRLKNMLAKGKEGSWTRYLPGDEVTSVFDAAQKYKAENTSCVVLAGKDYGMGSSRDWAAKGTYLLGVKAVLAESFERIHRSNLVGMGVLPLQFKDGETANKLGLTGEEKYSIKINDNLLPSDDVQVIAVSENGDATTFYMKCRIDTPVEVDYYKNGGILHYVLRQLIKAD